MIDKLIVNLNNVDIQNEDQLADFVSHESQVKGPLRMPQWRLFLKENFGEDKSIFILKIHHVMTDGYGIAVFLANVMDTYDEQVLPHLPELTFFQRIMMYLSLPYHWFMFNYTFKPYKHDCNPITSKTPYNSGVKQGYFAKEYSVAAVKSKSKEHKVTINDLVMTAISMTIK
jgi:NRPS condensation-like uncharacterized protein